MRTQSGFRATDFTGTPTSQVSEEGATVSGNVQILRSDGSIERQSGTWTLVEEGGEWKVDDIQTQPLPQSPGAEETTEMEKATIDGGASRRVPIEVFYLSPVVRNSPMLKAHISDLAIEALHISVPLVVDKLAASIWT